jgi:hypothetical protein
MRCYEVLNYTVVANSPVDAWKIVRETPKRNPGEHARIVPDDHIITRYIDGNDGETEAHAAGEWVVLLDRGVVCEDVG